MNRKYIRMRIVPIYVIIILAFIFFTLLFAKLNINLTKTSVEQLTEQTAGRICENLTQKINLSVILSESFSKNDTLKSWAMQEELYQDDPEFLSKLYALLSQYTYYDNCESVGYASAFTDRFYLSNGRYNEMHPDSPKDS